MNISIKSACIAAAIGLALPLGADGSEYDDQVRAQLAMAALAAMDDGYQLATDADIDRLNGSRSDRLRLTMQRGHQYMIVGRCDRDCSDPDFAPCDENSHEISKDQQTDDLPVVQVSPCWSGEFTLNVNMYACAANPCSYGAVMLRK